MHQKMHISRCFMNYKYRYTPILKYKFARIQEFNGILNDVLDLAIFDNGNMFNIIVIVHIFKIQHIKSKKLAWPSLMFLIFTECEQSHRCIMLKWRKKVPQALSPNMVLAAPPLLNPKFGKKTNQLQTTIKSYMFQTIVNLGMKDDKSQITDETSWL